MLKNSQQPVEKYVFVLIDRNVPDFTLFYLYELYFDHFHFNLKSEFGLNVFLKQ